MKENGDESWENWDGDIEKNQEGGKSWRWKAKSVCIVLFSCLSCNQVCQAEEDSSGEEGEQLDIRDLEFKLTHDLDKLQATSCVNQNLTLRDIDLLKIILCRLENKKKTELKFCFDGMGEVVCLCCLYSGLYPQLAITDDCNTWRKDSEQIFHTQVSVFLSVLYWWLLVSNFIAVWAVG